MRSKVTIFFMLFSFSVGAQKAAKTLTGYDPIADVLSSKYEAGHYLIYDCEDKHWVCVRDAYYQDCESKRTQEIEENAKDLSCVPLGYFPTKRSCFERQLYMLGQNFGTKFCLHPEWRHRDLELSRR